MRAEAAKALLSPTLRELLEETIRHPGIAGVCGELIGVGRFQDAANRAEQEMSRTTAAADNDGSATETTSHTKLAMQSATEAKVAWVLAQLHLSSVPATALSAALNEAGVLPAESSELNRTALVTSVLLIEKLLERGNIRLAASMLEQSFALLDQSFAGSAPAFPLLNQYFVAILDEELSRARSKREPAAYIEKLEQRIEERRAVRPAPAAVESKSSRRAGAPQLSAKTLFAEADEQPAPSGSKESLDALVGLSRTDEGTPESPSLEHRIIRPASGSGSAAAPGHRLGRRSMALLIATCLIIVCFGSWQLAFRRRGTADAGLQLAMHLVTPLTLDPEYPSSEVRVGDLLSQKMETLNASLTQVSARVKEMSSPGTPESESDNQNKGDVDSAALHSKEAQALQAKGQAKDAELVPLGGQTHPPVTVPPVDPRRVPRLEPNDLNGIQVHNLDRTDDTTSAHDLRVGPDGRVYGPPRSIDPAIGLSSPESARALDGTPLRSYEVEQYDQPKLYKTLVSTNVLAAPSHMAEALSHLDPETPIHVVSRIGPWLELVSAQGRRGYIFSQDAVLAANDR